MSRKGTSVLAYFSWVGWIIAFICGDREGASYHLNQALVLNILSVILEVARRFFGHIFLVKWVAYPAFGLAGFILFLLWLISLISALKDEERYIPVISDIHIVG